MKAKTAKAGKTRGPASPHQLTVRAYPVGFGDCFLLTWHYRSGDRHVLIDFGSTAKPVGAREEVMKAVAEDIAKVCERKLHAVVVTHRHADHINGFTTAKNGKAPGDMIRALEPDVVVQPWTEDPDAARESLGPWSTHRETRSLHAALDAMHAVAEYARREARALRGTCSPAVARELSFLGRDNLKNLSAIENLQTMASGKRAGHVYAHYGSRSGLETVLPGVQIRVLGPPTLHQSDAIRTMRSDGADQFWLVHGHTAAAVASGGTRLFPNAGVYESTLPAEARWFSRRMGHVRADQLLEIVRTLDAQMNNTSLILLFEAGGKRFLFPGDAQLENWMYALRDVGEAEAEANRELLRSVDLYKVGHHASRNATPKSLWALFDKKGGESKRGRITTVVSTRAGKHGCEKLDTEVPRRPLVQALKRESTFRTTQTQRSTQPIVLTFSLKGAARR